MYKYSEIKDMPKRELNKIVPAEHRIQYKTDEHCLFGSVYPLCAVTYECIKPELVDDNKPIHIFVSVEYNGTGHRNKDDLLKQKDVWKMVNREETTNG